MGNYSDFETDFVQRTLALIDQYNEMIEVLGKPFREQYNYTLTLNCLLGLIVLPKERALSFLLADRLTRQLKAEMGLHESQLPGPPKLTVEPRSGKQRRKDRSNQTCVHNILLKDGHEAT